MSVELQILLTAQCYNNGDGVNMLLHLNGGPCKNPLKTLHPDDNPDHYRNQTDRFKAILHLS